MEPRVICSRRILFQWWNVRQWVRGLWGPALQEGPLSPPTQAWGPKSGLVTGSGKGPPHVLEQMMGLCPGPLLWAQDVGTPPSELLCPSQVSMVVALETTSDQP